MGLRAGQRTGIGGSLPRPRATALEREPAEERPAVGTSPAGRAVAQAAWASAARCIATYIVLPGLAPALHLRRSTAWPLLLVLHLVGLGLAARALGCSARTRRVGLVLLSAGLLFVNVVNVVGVAAV